MSAFIPVNIFNEVHTLNSAAVDCRLLSVDDYPLDQFVLFSFWCDC